MNDTAKYLIHARITADGVVERSDVVGAVFGQTEGLLGDELDLRDLQQSSKIGRIDVSIDSENGQSFGEITIGSGLDKVETSILAASLEAITRVGPCEARVEVTSIEDMRAAQRREVVERAKELLADSFDESVMDSTEILTEVREANRVERIDEYEELPAGPRVHDSDAVVVVEGRADVLTLLRAGIKNGVAVEGTNVPEAVADLTRERTVTAFLDGDRGGELILKELAQVGDIDYVAFAPEGRSVEDLSRAELMAALREKAPFESVDLDAGAASEAEPADDAADGEGTPSAADGSTGGLTDEPTDASEQSTGIAVTDGSSQPAPDDDDDSAGTAAPESPESPGTPESTGSDPTDPGEPAESTESTAPTGSGGAVAVTESASAEAGADATDAGGAAAADATTGADSTDRRAADDAAADDGPPSLRDHVETVIASGSNRARLLDAEYGVLDEVPAADTVEAVSGADEPPFALVVDGEVSQRVLDVAAQRGVEQVVGETEGEYVKRPASVHVVTADRLLSV